MIAREMTARDRRFVVPTWVHGSSYSIPIARRWRIVDRLIDGGARVMVLATNDITVHAWAAADGGVLHYAYLPPELRGKGMGARIIALALGEYPETIRTSHPWPFADTNRYRLSKRAERRVYALAHQEAA